MTISFRLIAKIGVGFLAVIGALYFLGLFLIPPCDMSQIAEVPSPGGTMVAHHIRTNCGRADSVESQVWVGEPNTGVSGRVVFASPFEYSERTSGQTRRTELKLVWRSEDLLEISYSPDVWPRDPGHDFEQNGLRVHVASKYIK